MRRVGDFQSECYSSRSKYYVFPFYVMWPSANFLVKKSQGIPCETFQNNQSNRSTSPQHVTLTCLLHFCHFTITIRGYRFLGALVHGMVWKPRALPSKAMIMIQKIFTHKKCNAAQEKTFELSPYTNPNSIEFGLLCKT